MPLESGKSRKAFEENVKTEVEALKAKGVPHAEAIRRAVAIAYTKQREAKKRK